MKHEPYRSARRVFWATAARSTEASLPWIASTDSSKKRSPPAARILGFQDHYEQIAQPFKWKFTRRDFDRLLTRWFAHNPEEPALAA